MASSNKCKKNTTNEMTKKTANGAIKFDLVYVDCPWKYYGSSTKNAAAGKHYKLMGQDSLKSLPVKSVLNKKAAVFMWATCPRLDYAIEVMKAWGLHYRGVAFVWVKTRKKDNGIINGQGVPPTFTKPTTELLLLGTTKKTGRMIPLRKFNTPQVILSPRGEHSEKPEIFRKKIEETLKPPYTKLEMFARRVTPGWTAIGDSINGDDIFVALAKLNGTYQP